MVINHNPDVFKILSVDGGGLRGVIAAHILSRIEQQFGINIYEHFDMFAGTSTGSIIVGGLVTGKSASYIKSIYQINGAGIFSQKIKSFIPNKLKILYHSKYDNSQLINLLSKEFQEIKLKEINKPLLIPATDVGNGGVHIFKSEYSGKFTRDGNRLLCEAILASCSAPLYFNPVTTGEYLLADGGLWANNPSLVAVIDAMCRLNIEKNRIKILSLGTGHQRTAYGKTGDQSWGFVKGWKREEFVNFLLSLQAESTQNYIQLFLDTDQILRINFESDNDLPLDDPSITDSLISKADKMFTYMSDEIFEFLNK